MSQENNVLNESTLLSNNNSSSDSSTLAKCIEQMIEKRIHLEDDINNDEEALKNLLIEIDALKTKETKLRKKIQLNKKKKTELEQTISETKTGYQRIVEATNTLMEIITKQHLPKYNIGTE